jgi:hypothetical protein
MLIDRIKECPRPGQSIVISWRDCMGFWPCDIEVRSQWTITLRARCRPCIAAIIHPTTIAARKKSMDLFVMDEFAGARLCPICTKLICIPEHSACTPCRERYVRDYNAAAFLAWVARQILGQDIAVHVGGYLVQI